MRDTLAASDRRAGGAPSGARIIGPRRSDCGNGIDRIICDLSSSALRFCIGCSTRAIELKAEEDDCAVAHLETVR